VKQFVYVEKS